MNSPVKINGESELSEIVFAHPKIVLFLQHFNIYVPLNEKNVAKICNERNIRVELFLALLNLYLGKEFATPNGLLIADLPVIINYLANSHRYYQEDIYPNIQTSVRKLYELNNTPEIKMVDRFFQDYFSEVETHLQYENEVTFPYIDSLYKSLTEGQRYVVIENYSVEEYQEHHNDIEEKLDDLMHLLIKYLPLQKDNQVRRELFMHLAELNYDLHIHSQIEDLIVIPLVKKMEKQINELDE